MSFVGSVNIQCCIYLAIRLNALPSRLYIDFNDTVNCRFFSDGRHEKFIYRNRNYIYLLTMAFLIMLIVYSVLTTVLPVSKWKEVMWYHNRVIDFFVLYIYSFFCMVVLHNIVRIKSYILAILYLYYLAAGFGAFYLTHHYYLCVLEHINR